MCFKKLIDGIEDRSYPVRWHVGMTITYHICSLLNIIVSISTTPRALPVLYHHATA